MSQNFNIFKQREDFPVDLWLKFKDPTLEANYNKVTYLRGFYASRRILLFGVFLQTVWELFTKLPPGRRITDVLGILFWVIVLLQCLGVWFLLTPTRDFRLQRVMAFVCLIPLYGMVVNYCGYWTTLLVVLIHSQFLNQQLKMDWRKNLIFNGITLYLFFLVIAPYLFKAGILTNKTWTVHLRENRLTFHLLIMNFLTCALASIFEKRSRESFHMS